MLVRLVIDIKIRKIVLVVMKFVKRDRYVIKKVIFNVCNGIFFWFNFEKDFLVNFLWFIVYSICVDVYNFEFVIDKIVVRIIKFIIFVVYGILILLKI